MAARKFLRRTSNRYSKLGLRRKSKQKWVKPTGRDNKMREKRRGYPAVVSVGYKGAKQTREKMDGKEIIVVRNLQDLNKVGENSIATIGRVGEKKKIEILMEAEKMKIEILNENSKKYLKEINLKNKKK